MIRHLQILLDITRSVILDEIDISTSNGIGTDFKIFTSHLIFLDMFWSYKSSNFKLKHGYN